MKIDYRLNEINVNCDIDDVYRKSFEQFIHKFFLSINRSKLKCSKQIKSMINQGKRVKQIDYDKSIKNSNELIAIKCTDDSIYYAKYVICATDYEISTEKHHLLFHPKLSIDKYPTQNQFIEVIVAFEESFPVKNAFVFGLIWNEMDLQRVEAITNLKWISGIFCFYIDHKKSNILRIRLNGIDKIRSMNDATENEIIYGIKCLINLFKPGWKLSNIISMKK